MTLNMPMEGRLRFLSVASFYISFILIASLTGLLFDLHSGVWVGLIFSLFILYILFKYGEKLILLLSKARYVTDDEALVNQIKNFCTHLDIPEIKVYWSSTYYNNIYFVNSYWGTPSIILGKGVFNDLTKNELNSLIYATLLRIKSVESKHRSTVNLVSLVLFWWIFLGESLFENQNIKKFFYVMLYPAFYFKSKFYKKNDDSIYFDSEIYKHELLKRDYVSALFKINKKNLCLPMSVGSFVLTGLTHTHNTSDDTMFYILVQNETPIEDRVKAIAGILK